MSAPRTALVLGGTSDIGLAVLRHLTPHGLERVVLACRTPPDPAPAVPGAEVTTLRWDATEVDRHEGVLDAAWEHLGHVDLVVCSAGMLGHHAGRSMGPAAVEEMIRVNAAGPAAALSLVADRMAAAGAGDIVVMSSVAAVRPRRSNYVYGASKAALDAYGRGLGDALVGTGVRVLVVRPGFVRSRMTEGLEPAPFACDPPAVAEAVAAALRRRRGGVVWVPRRLGPLFAVLSNLPTPIWRKVAGDR